MSISDVFIGDVLSRRLALRKASRHGLTAASGNRTRQVALLRASNPRPPQESTMKIENLEDLFNHTLEDIYYAENKLVKALPKMAKACDSSALAKAFMGHCEETKEHITRLDEVFKAMGRKSKATECPAIKGILEEGEELMSEIKDPDTRDAAMIAAGQAAEHYEITRYGTLVSWAKLLGHKDVATILEKTLKEEYGADDKLTKLAESRLNKEAA
jgi:ferritin-like metal-binding protein YciE